MMSKSKKKYSLLHLIMIFFKKAFYKLFLIAARSENKIIEKKEKKEKIKEQKKLKKEKILAEKKEKKQIELQKKNEKREKKRQYSYIKNLAKSKKYKYVFVFYPYIDWNIPIFQRPQQIALSMTQNRNDILYLFCTSNPFMDNLDGLYKKINDNLYIISDYEYLCNLKIKNRVMHFYSTDMFSKYTDIENSLKRKDKVLYEYIDEITESITGEYLEGYVEKHNRILKNDDIYIVATADRLYNEVKGYRNSKLVLSTNGVHVKDFDKLETFVPDDLKEIKEKYDKVICYYGSFAVWFDYKLVDKCAKKYPNYAFLLIGYEYDSSLRESNILDNKNIYYIGKRPYNELVNYTKNVDLLTIPFLINDITNSTSPVKLFEYMAVKKPIITTAMPECKKYKSVVIGDNHDDFIKKIESTIELNNDEDYLIQEYNEALENSWDKKANIIIDLLDNN